MNHLRLIHMNRDNPRKGYECTEENRESVGFE